MYCTVKKVLDVARSEIGYHEKNSAANLDDKTAPNDGMGNFTKFARDLAAAGYYNGSKQGYAWCDVFVDWCFYMACERDRAKAEEVECQTGPYGAGVGFSARYYKDQNRFYTSGPQAGDQIFFGDSDHTGLVESVSDGYVTTIEGNTSDGTVQRKKYRLTNTWIMGYGRPKYDKEDEEMRYEKLRDVKDGTYRKTLDKLISKGVLAGKGGSGEDLILDLGEDAIRVLVYLDRQGVFGE